MQTQLPPKTTKFNIMKSLRIIPMLLVLTVLGIGNVNPLSANDFELQKEADFWHEKMQTSSEGIVLGQLINEKIKFAAAGRMTEAGPVVDENTLFEIGSITKVFTGVLLADTILQKKAALNDLISKHLPEGTISESSPLAKITLLDLVSHTSGLPRLPSDLSVGSKIDNPYNHYSRERLFKYLSTFVAEDLGEVGKYLYSNMGFGLLGEILANINGTTYDRLLQVVILEPLNMRSSFVQVSLDSIPNHLKDRFARGHDKGNPTSHWSLNAFAGAGGIVLSAHDLLIFANAQWDSQTPSRLQKAFKLASKRWTDKMGLGWHITPKGLFHDGQTGGFKSLLDVSVVSRTVKISLKNGTGPAIKIVRSGNFEKIVGFWRGTLDTGKKKLRTVMHLTSEGDTSFYSIDQGGSIIPALKTEIDNTRFFAYFPTIKGIFIGTINDNGNLINGTWAQSNKYSFKMERSDGIPASLQAIFKEKYQGDFSDLAGFWSGHLGGPDGLFVFLEVEQFNKVHELKIWSPSQSLLPIAVNMAKFHNNKLYLESKNIDGRYTGKLSNDGKTMSGIWSQGKNTAVTFHWSAVRPKDE